MIQRIINSVRKAFSKYDRVTYESFNRPSPASALARNSGWKSRNRNIQVEDNMLPWNDFTSPNIAARNSSDVQHR